ncbi:MAG TPA: 3-oxoacyl-ACP synthase III [Victivallales bacterium]|nr:3-oxoacyl-ACP synthase III [Victivallales bacterium]HPO90163.1 3-oxoacyl-ACP synthase III [Victivallales bacterium]HRR28817.1 3-oxoacyl-ACP synthase III [Victivallales bacterium]
MLYKNPVLDTLIFEEAPEVLSSEQLEKMLEPLYSRLKLSEGRLELMTGIRERRLWPRGFKPSDAAILAGKKALQKSSVPKEKIKCLIMCSVCRDFLEPATATVVHNALSLPSDCFVLDISNACLGFLSGIIILSEMIDNGRIEAGLLVSGENSRALIESTVKMLNENEKINRRELKRHFSSLTIGSGAIAAIISSKEISPYGHKIIGEKTSAYTEANKLCRGTNDTGMSDDQNILMNTDSETLLIKGIEAASNNWEKFKKELSWNNQSPDIICTHQVGVAHRKMLFERLNLPIERDFSNFEKYGNMGTVSCPSCLALAENASLIKAKSNVALLGIGSGINCTMIGIQW